MNGIARVLLAGAAAGFAGFVLEDVVVGPRYSEVFGPGKQVPFLPVYAVGGMAAALVQPAVRGWSWPMRGLAYGGTLTLVEGVAGKLERDQGRASWDYNGAVVDATHAVAWGGLALLAEAALGMASE